MLTTAPTTPSEVDQLRTQITQLTKQIAALTVMQNTVAIRLNIVFAAINWGTLNVAVVHALLIKDVTYAIDQGTMLETAGRKQLRDVCRGRKHPSHQ